MTTDTTDTPAVPETVPESVLADLDQERQAAQWQLEFAQSQANDWERQVRGLEAAREFIASRIGRTWEAVRAEATAELAKSETALAAAQEHLREAQERERDLLGHVRCLRQAQKAARPAGAPLPRITDADGPPSEPQA